MDKLKLIEAIIGSECGSVSEGCPWKKGEKVFIRTVTHHLTGRIVDVIGDFIVLEDAAWIADDGRFMDCINVGKLNEVEPVNGKVRVNTTSFIDVYEWQHDLPRGQK